MRRALQGVILFAALAVVTLGLWACLVLIGLTGSGVVR